MEYNFLTDLSERVNIDAQSLIYYQELLRNITFKPETLDIRYSDSSFDQLLVSVQSQCFKDSISEKDYDSVNMQFSLVRDEQSDDYLIDQVFFICNSNFYRIYNVCNHISDEEFDVYDDLEEFAGVPTVSFSYDCYSSDSVKHFDVNSVVPTDFSGCNILPDYVSWTSFTSEYEGNVISFTDTSFHEEYKMFLRTSR